MLATFAGAFPADDPAYVLIISLDEGHEMSGTREMRTAGYTAAPVTQAVLARIGPLLGMRPTSTNTEGLEGLQVVRN